MPTTISGSLKSIATGAVTSSSNAFIRFVLRGTRGAQPTVVGTGAIAPLLSADGMFYSDIPSDGSGNVSGTIYSTRDATGLLGGDITVAGNTTAVNYGMIVYNNGVAGPEIPVHAKNGATIDVSNVTAISTPIVVTAPTGDSTYARLDGGNTPFTGLVEAQAGILTNKLNNIRFADQFSGADSGAKINAAIADLPSAGGIVDARGIVGDLAISTAIQINKPVHLLLGGNLTYSGAGIAAGILQLLAGSSGSRIEAPYMAFATDSGDNGAAVTGNVQALVVTPSSTMPVISVATDVHDVCFKNLLIVGNANVTDGIQHNGGVRLVVDHCCFSRPVSTSSFPTGWGVNGTVAVQDGSQVKNSAFLGWGGCVKFDGSIAPGSGDGNLLIANNFFVDVSLGYVSIKTTFDAQITDNWSGFSFLAANTAGILIQGSSTSPTISNFHFDSSNASGNSGVIDIKITGTCIGGSITNCSLNGNTADSNSAHDPDHAIDIGASVSFLRIENNQIENYAAGGTVNNGSHIRYAGNKWTAGHAGTGSEIITGVGGSFVLNDSGNAPLSAFLYFAQMFRSGGSSSFPDIYGDGTNALVLGGKSDGSGTVKFGATSAVQVPSTLAIGGDSLMSANPRGIYSGFIPGTGATGTFAQIAFDKAITITRVQIVTGTNGSGQTTAAIIRVGDNASANVDTTLANGTASFDSGAVAVNVAAATNVVIRVNTASSGGTSPANVNVVVQYRMQ